MRTSIYPLVALAWLVAAERGHAATVTLYFRSTMTLSEVAGAPNPPPSRP